MSNLTLDGSTSFIGTEFIKLLATGSSNLATEEYVDDAIEQNGGGGGGNVDLSNYYTQTEVDNLLNNKLNSNNPQDITGTLRIDSTNGNGKLVVNALGAPNDEDFYVNGLSNLGGTLKAQVIQASSNIETSQQIKSNTINTYSNSNMIIQRNAIPYITLDSQIIDDETVEKIILMKDVEFSGNLSLNTLSVDTLNTIGLNDMVFNVATLGEFLRFQVSDNTVRVPNTRSFLSQDIYLDNLRPLTFSNDVVFNGGNSTNDAYEEYVRLDASAERMIVSKATKFENNIQFNVGQNISWTNVFIREVFSSRPEFDLIVNGSTSHLRLWVNGSVKQAITNTTIACKVNIDAEQGITVFNGQQLTTNTVNSHTNSNLVFQRSGSPYMTFQSNRIDIDQPLHLANSLTIDLADKLTMRPSLEGGVNIFDIRNLHPVADNPMIRFRVGEGAGETIVCEMTNNAVAVSRNLIMGTAYELRTNAIDTVNDNDLVISRNNIPFLTLDKFTEDTVEKEAIICNKQLRANRNMLINNLQINQFQSGVEYADFRLHNADSVVRFFVGNSTNPNFQITNANINLNRETTIGSVKTNTINSNGNNTLNIQQNGNTFISLLGDALNRVQINRFLRVVDGGESTQAQFVNNSNGNYMEFRLGNHINAYASGTPVNGNTLHLNYYSHGNVMLGTNQDTGDDPIPTISINKFTSNTGNAFEVQGNSVFSGTASTNTLNSESGDLTIQRDGTDVLNIFSYTPTNGPSIIVDAQSDCGISSSWLFANTFANRTGNTDTEFRGAIAGGLSSGKVYMKYLHASETLDFDCVIDNTGRSVIGNILDTTVSDERLKTDIEDVDTDFTSCIKNVKVKTFKYKYDKYKTNDNYGFIAQELKEHLPKECKNIVKENKVKNEDETFLSINYMKLSVVLWKCCQEQQSKIEHLESSMYEMMEDIKELKGKKTTKPKAKAKSKTKSENK